MNLYVGNLLHELSEDTLKQEFEAFGEVTSVNIIKDKFTGKSRGFGFIEMPNETEANNAINSLNGKDLGGRNIVVAQANAREAKPRREGSRFGGSRGGNGGGSRGGFGGRSRDENGGGWGQKRSSFGGGNGGRRNEW